MYMFVDVPYWRRFHEQRNYVAMNSVSSQHVEAYIQAWTGDSLLLLHNYYDYWTHVLIRQQYIRQDAALSQGGRRDALYISKSRK